MHTGTSPHPSTSTVPPSAPMACCFPPSADLQVVNRGLLLRSVELFRKQAEAGAPENEMRSCCISLSQEVFGRQVCHHMPWQQLMEEEMLQMCTRQKSLTKLVFARASPQCYMRRYHLLPFIISFFYILQLCKEEIKNGSFSNLGKFWQQSDL